MTAEHTPLMTIFTAPKPFDDPHISLIQRNAIVSWLNLGSVAEVFLIGNEKGVAETAHRFGVKYFPEVERNSQGTPLVSSIFNTASQNSTSPILTYLNADILVLPDILSCTRLAMQTYPRFLLVGQRWDVDVRENLEVKHDLTAWLHETIHSQGKMHPQGGSDYFIYPRDNFDNMPEFAIGRAGWDNWMIYHARFTGMKVIDGTSTINIIHQQHDYGHLPQGQPHYRTPETFENVRLAGGKRMIFDLKDTTHQFIKDKIVRKPLSWKRSLRQLEIFPLITLKSKTLGQVSYGLFHPMKAYRELRAWLRTRKSVRVE